MKSFNIDKNNSNRRLDKFMQSVMTNAPASEIYKSLRKKKVRVNGRHIDGAYRLCDGDVVCMYINDEFFTTDKPEFSWINAPSDINIIYEDNNILIANKPSGMHTQDTDDDANSLESRMRSYLYQKGEVDLNAVPLFIPSLCHRIDRNTSGLIIGAKNSAALRMINEKIRNREIRKFYLCETESAPKPKNGRICGWLKKDSKSRSMKFYDKKVVDAARCETLYKTVRDGSPTLVEVELLTGRTHQIRACLSHIGCPLIGDVKYGAAFDGKIDYQHLISYKIIFAFKSHGGILEYLKDKEIKISYEF